jgi:hypothetical protein
MTEQSASELRWGGWSQRINGLSGRLCIEFEDLKPGLRHAVYLELRNHSFTPVALTNQPRIHADLFSSSGERVNPSGFSASGPIPIPQWAVIPRDAYIGFRIDMQTIGVPTRERGAALMAVGGQSWELTAGEYVLKIAAVFQKDEGGPENQWVGELALPPAQFVVTAHMLSVNT